VGAFEVAPHSRASRPRTDDKPVVAWEAEDLAILARVGNATTLAILDLCTERPEEWVPTSDVYERAGVTSASGTGQLGGFGLTVRSRFSRSNAPFEREWGVGGAPMLYYRLTAELAETWAGIRAVGAPPDSEA
jgi:hypothetical protein